jgi:hypothetical protein
MKKLLAVSLLLAVMVGTLGGCALSTHGLGLLFAPQETVDTENTLHWLPEESYFVDYKIIGNDVRFRYAICFVNNSGDDCSIQISAKFYRKNLRGWTNRFDFLEACDENGDWEYRKIRNGEKAVFTYCFTVPYTGGTVTTDMEFPEEIMLSMKYDE